MATTPQGFVDNPLASCNDGVAVSASDSVADPNGPFKCLYCGATGDVKITTVGNTAGSLTLVAVPTGTILPFRVQRVWSTGTTDATKIVGGK